MTKKTVRSKPRATKRTISSTDVQPKKAASVPPTPTPRPEPTFTLRQFHQAFGYNYVGTPTEPLDPVQALRDALDDAVRTLRLVEENLVGDVDRDPLRDVVCNATYRGLAAIEVFGEFTARKMGGAALAVTP